MLHLAYIFKSYLLIFFNIKECTDGWYGENCKQQCSGHCRDKYVCNHVTGHCVNGCAAGWRGTLCDKGLPKLMFVIRIKT